MSVFGVQMFTRDCSSGSRGCFSVTITCKASTTELRSLLVQPRSLVHCQQCSLMPAFHTTRAAVRVSHLRYHHITRPIHHANGRSFSSAKPEAYLEPVSGHKGIVALTLNRPAAKNAISVRLLDVRVNALSMQKYFVETYI
jgi:hypothetical protein